MLGMFSGVIAGALQKKGNVLLEDHFEGLTIGRRFAAKHPLQQEELDAAFRDCRFRSGRVLHRRGASEGLWRSGAHRHPRPIPGPLWPDRFGVAPDHQSLKAVSKRYDKVAETAGVDFIGNVYVGRDVSVAELLELYDAVILATGAPKDRKLGIPGEDLPGVFGSAEFVGWYNGHPDFADLDPPLDGTHAVVIGNGNVALDCARILSKTRHEFEGSDIVGHALDALDAPRSRP